MTATTDVRTSSFLNDFALESWQSVKVSASVIGWRLALLRMAAPSMESQAQPVTQFFLDVTTADPNSLNRTVTWTRSSG